MDKEITSQIDFYHELAVLTINSNFNELKGVSKLGLIRFDKWFSKKFKERPPTSWKTTESSIFNLSSVSTTRYLFF